MLYFCSLKSLVPEPADKPGLGDRFAGLARQLRRRMRAQSLLALQLAGFAVVAFPLFVGLILSNQQIDRVTRQSEQLLDRSISATQLARQIGERIVAFERSARQHSILQDSDARASLIQRYQTLSDELDAFVRRNPKHERQVGIEAIRNQADQLMNLTLDDRSRPDWSDRVDAEFQRLNSDARDLIAAMERASERELERLEEMGSAARNSSLVGLAMTVLAAVILSLLMAGYLNRHIRKLDRSVRALARPDQARIEQISSPRDLRALSVRLEWVRRRLVRTERDRRRLVGEVSHELKTPLSAIREGASLLADQSFGRLGERQSEVIGILQASIDRLQEQIENLLRFNRLQSGPHRAMIQTVHLQPLFDRVVAGHALSLDARDIRLERNASPALTVAADPDMLATAIDNLISNALKFSPVGGRIGIFAGQRGERAIIQITDCGPGVHVRDRSRLFEPFFRGTKPQTRSKPGSGLGLAICRDLIRANQGEVRLARRTGWSCVFEIELPMTAAGKRAP